MVAVEKNTSLKRSSDEELILQRRKTNSPTIEDDFTIEEDEPLHEPCPTPKQNAKVELNERGNEGNPEGHMLTSTKSNSKEKSRSTHSIFWSLSELEDNSNKIGSRNRSHNATRNSRSIRQLRTLLPNRGKKSQTGVQFRVEKPYQKPENAAIRRERSMDEESNVFDEVSACSLPSRAPSVAISVTKRIRNTRYPNLRSPRLRTPRTPRTVAEDSIFEDVIEEEAEYVEPKRIVHKEDEDVLDRVVEQVEDRVCESSHHRKSYRKKKRVGLRRIMNPLLERLEKFDNIFEQFEDIACSKERQINKSDSNATAPTAADLAAEAFSQLMSQIDQFDPGFKTKAMECQHRCNLYWNSTGYSFDEYDDDYSESSFVSNEYLESSERAYHSSKTVVKEQNHSSVEGKHQLEVRNAKENSADEAQQELVSESNNTENASIPVNPKKCLGILQSTVGSVSKKFLHRSQCASSSINVAESRSFDEYEIEYENSMIEIEEQAGNESMAQVHGKKEVDLIIASPTNEMDFEQDERPPMRRLMESGTDRRSIGSGVNRRQRRNGGNRSLHSMDMPNGCELADSIRHASISGALKELNRASKDPRGNKLKTDDSVHVRSTSPPPRIKLDIDSELMKQHELVRSPRSSETNETSDLTALTSASSDIVMTQMTSSRYVDF